MSYSDRKKFLKQLGILGIGITGAPLVVTGCSPSSEKVGFQLNAKLGLQIYSLRNELNNDLESTIQAIAAMGYEYIEAYGLGEDGLFFGQYTPEEFTAIVTNAGLRVASIHTSYFTADKSNLFISAAKTLGAQHIVIPYLDQNMRDNYDGIADNLNAIGTHCFAEGLRFGYHNHDFEFIPTDDGRIPMRILIENTDADKVSFQADLYWITKAGVDALAFVREYPGRFMSYHVKDANRDLEQTTVGTGIIPFIDIFELNELTGVEYLFVEDERTDDPLQNVQNALSYLKSL